MYSEIVREILREYEKKRDKAQNEALSRKEEVYKKIPNLRDIDISISRTGFLISQAVLSDPDSYLEKANEIKNQLEKLKQDKAILLTENNIPVNYIDINYCCSMCNDTGFLHDNSKCNCFKQSLIDKFYNMSNIKTVLNKENFKAFNINVFSDEIYEEGKLSPKENMMNILSICDGFVINFDEENGENLLFFGTTGQGKTFMSNCIAKSLLDKGKIVIYQTAFKILEIIADYKFRRNSSDNEYQYKLLFESDLLIIDDLGTELTNSFTNTEIFNIINSRLINGNKTIISTNLSLKQIADTYTDRVYSRVASNFRPLKFYGPDLRWDK